MNRIIALLLPFVCISASGLRSGSAARSDPAALAAAWKASLAAETGRDIDEAVRQVTAFEAGGGDRYLSALRLGWLEYGRGNYSRAVELYQFAAKQQPLALQPQTGLMNTLIASGDIRRGTAAAEVVLRIEPTNYSALMVLSNIAYGAGDYRKALAGYRRVLSTYPGDVDATSGAAWSSLKLGDRTEAAKSFRLILSLNPDYNDAQRGLELAGHVTR